MTGIRTRSTVFRALTVICCIQAASATLFPKQVPELDSLEELMPNVERSVKDCPFSIYGHGGVALASSIFVDRYVDKTFSHTVRVLNDDAVCVGLIVDENHVLTTSDCASSEDDDSLPKIKLSNETLDALNTAEKFPHPVYNVTLLRLNSSIVINKLAVPTCFWDTDFNDGFDKIQTIFIAPNGSLIMQETQCTFQNRVECMTGLIQKSSLLQTRAIANYRMHPFVFTFGIEDTGDALQSMKYIPWMESLINRNISSTECTATYEEYRDFEDSMTSRSESHQQVQYSKSRLTTTNINQYRARIVPNATETGSKRHCYGSLIAPKYILTAANCLKQYEGDGYQVEMAQKNVWYPVRYNELKVRTVAQKVHYHPDFDAATLANDIALLELVNPIPEFNETIVPACIWTRDKLPADMFQTNGYVPFNATIDDENVRTHQLYATSDVYDECIDKVSENQLCAGFPTALAPSTCHNSVGSAMSHALYTFGRYFEYIFAINSKGENCGFNRPSVFTKIAPYVQWIDSIIFASKVRYEDETKYYGDRCQDENGTEGTCVALRNCPKLDQEAKQGKAVNLSSSCSFGKQTEMVVCCSDENVLRDEAHREQLAQVIEEIDNCPHLYHEHRKNKSPYDVDNFPTYPYLVRIHGNGDRSCNGTLITKQFVLTTASCYENLAVDDIYVVVGNKTLQKIAVKHTFTHPEFSKVPTEFNLLLLKLETAVTINNETIPACLWKNQTHTPLRLEEVYANPNFTHQHCFPIFNTECLRKYPDSNVTNLQLCVERNIKYYYPYVVVEDDAGSALVNHAAQGVNEYQVTYLVGLFGSGHTITKPADDEDERPVKQYYHVYQRISEHYNWIKNVISVAMQNN
ncbi:uncharacterized protein LOC126567238 [Anopheles maculipalpis]|uniref:uncharacterized protein LOC126567238 n=1 Tax=Anopheles maculipalpis TaxID=1496333 RepID=UPI0021593432|nr:uncharacterized protein LOC126567238 [Anopheles maculipalpis]